MVLYMVLDPDPVGYSTVSKLTRITSFLHQQVTNEDFTYMTSPFCGCKVEITMKPLYLSIFNTNVKLTI